MMVLAFHLQLSSSLVIVPLVLLRRGSCGFISKSLSLEALKSLTEQKCKVVPSFLDTMKYSRMAKAVFRAVYIDYIVWAHVPRESIDSKDF